MLRRGVLLALTRILSLRKMEQDSLNSLESEFFQKFYNESSNDLSIQHVEKVSYWTEPTVFCLYTLFSFVAFLLYMNCQRECSCRASGIGSEERETLWSQEDNRYVGFILLLTTWFSGALCLVAKVPWWIFFVTLSVLSIYLALMIVNYLINKCRSYPSEELRDVVVENPRSRRCRNLLFHRMQCRAPEDQDLPSLARRIDLKRSKKSKPKKTQ